MSQQKNSATGTFTGKSDVFLRIQTRRAGLIKGESVDPKHLDEIQVSSWHWGLSSPTAIGTTHATGRRSYTGLTINKFIDASTTALMSVLATNDEVKEAKPKPKFWIVSEWRVDILGLQQSASPVARREAIATYLQENIAGLPLTEKLPTKETVKEYIDKLAPAAPINLRIHSINPD